MHKLCIIPARGGSKRIPRKNIKLFLGKPIIAYSIEAATASGLFDEIMVSTDDEEIAEIAKRYGAKVPFFRSKKNADDYATTIEVVKEVVDTYKKAGAEFQHICCLYPCAPFVTANKIQEAYTELLRGKYDSVFPVLEYSFPIQRAMRFSTDKKIEMIQKEYIITRSQDLEKTYHDAGQFYWMQTQKVLPAEKLFTDNSGAIIITELEGQDIDNEMDWKLAELKFKLRQNEK